MTEHAFQVVICLGCLALLCSGTIFATWVNSVYRDEDIGSKLKKITEQERRDSDVLFHQLHVKGFLGPRPSGGVEMRSLRDYQAGKGNQLPKFVTELSRYNQRHV